MLVGDLTDKNALSDAIQNSEVVYNFAATADLDDALNKPIETVKVNFLGNAQILDTCRVAKIKRYVYASTIYVYSRDGGFYRCSKQAAEHYVEEYQRSYNLDYTILRYGSLYGPRSDYRNGLWRIVKNALETGNISYEGSPEAIREYIHVEDAARSSVDALKDEFRIQHVILSGHQPMRGLSSKAKKELRPLRPRGNCATSPASSTWMVLSETPPVAWPKPPASRLERSTSEIDSADASKQPA